MTRRGSHGNSGRIRFLPPRRASPLIALDSREIARYRSAGRKDAPSFKEEMAMSNFNVFNWIREGVKQSVLLGVSDALEHIGAAPDGEEAKPRLMEFARRSELLPSSETPRTEAKPKRLGRSLREME